MFKSFNAGHLGINTSLLGALELAKASGFEGCDFGINQVQEAGPEAVAPMFKNQGLKYGVWNLPFMPYLKEEDWKSGLAALPAQAKAGKFHKRSPCRFHGIRSPQNFQILPKAAAYRWEPPHRCPIPPTIQDTSVGADGLAY